MSEKSEAAKKRGLAAKMTADLSARGYSLVSTAALAPPRSSEALEITDSILSELGELIPVFPQHDEWRPIGVRLDREPNRSEGVGHSPLHMDFVNAKNPPDLVVLYCALDDPLGGGATLLASNSVVRSLPREAISNLARPIYSDGQVVGLRNVGEDVNPFSVVCNESRWSFRYTGRLARTALDEDAKRAVRQLDSTLRSHLHTFRLKPGDLVVIDQHRTVHGREPLGPGQAGLAESDRRLLWQRFIRTG